MKSQIKTKVKDINRGNQEPEMGMLLALMILLEVMEKIMFQVLEVKIIIITRKDIQKVQIPDNTVTPMDMEILQNHQERKPILFHRIKIMNPRS